MFLVDFDPATGAEIKKSRPALILQNDIYNQYSSTTIVAAISSFAGKKVYPTNILLEAGAGGLERPSIVLFNQIRTIDKSRLKRRLGTIDDSTMQAVETALLISLGLYQDIFS